MLDSICVRTAQISFTRVLLSDAREDIYVPVQPWAATRRNLELWFD